MKRALFFLTLCTILSLTASSGALFAENTQEENAVLSEIVKLNQEKWAQIQSIRVEYDILRLIEGNETPDKGNYWEVSGDEYRYFVQFSETQPVDLKYQTMKMCLEGYANKEKQYELKVPKTLYPLGDSVDLIDETTYRHVSATIRDIRNVAIKRIEVPFLEVVAVPQKDDYVVTSLAEFLKDENPAEVKTYSSEDGDKIAEIRKRCAEENLLPNQVSWNITITINLSKGATVTALVSEDVYKSQDNTLTTYIVEVTGSNSKEFIPGIWEPQTIKSSNYVKELGRESGLSSEFTITSLSINQPFPTPINDFKFPVNLTIREFTSDPSQTKIRIWGKDNSL